MNKTKIEWCDYTWNPITGCMRSCRYCYARRLHDRFNKEPFSVIRYHPSRMDDLEWLGKQEPSTIFVGSMSDIEYWPENLTQHILDEIKLYHRHTFMFLSKNPNSYGEWRGLKFPSNCMQGLTLEKCDTIEEHKKLALLVGNCERPFVSLEPIQGNVSFDGAWQVLEKIIVGAMTGPKAIIPKQEWIDSIQEFIRGDKIFWKQNIKKIGALKIKEAGFTSSQQPQYATAECF